MTKSGIQQNLIYSLSYYLGESIWLDLNQTDDYRRINVEESYISARPVKRGGQAFSSGKDREGKTIYMQGNIKATATE